MKYIVFLCAFLGACSVFGYNYMGSDGKGYTISEYYQESANFLVSKNIIVDNKGELQKYRLENTITRAELIGISLKVAGIDLPDTYNCKKYYQDVSAVSPNNWACRAIEIAADNGIVTRENSYFRPNDNITKAEALGILMKAKNIQYEHNIQKPGYKPGTPQWQIDILEGAVKNKIVEEHETYGVNAPAIRGEIFRQAVNTLISTGEVINKNYHYLVSAGNAYHYGHRMQGVDGNSFSLMEGDFFKTKSTVYKNFGCYVLTGCGESSIINVPISPNTAKVVGYHFIVDQSAVWNCESNRCVKVEVDARNFTCLDSIRVCGDLDQAFDLGGSQMYPFLIDANYSYAYNAQFLPRIYSFFMFFKHFETARKLVSKETIPQHNTLETRIKNGVYTSGNASHNMITFFGDGYGSINADITIDQEVGKIESIYIQE